MIEKTYKTNKGIIHYWISKFLDKNKDTLIMLPGLTADHRLFEKQIEYFKDKYNLFVWDAPGHSLSRPFDLDFSLMDKAKWLHDIIELESIINPIFIGQSMGGYVSQCYLELFKNSVKGFVSIDSAPLLKEYISNLEIFLGNADIFLD